MRVYVSGVLGLIEFKDLGFRVLGLRLCGFSEFCGLGVQGAGARGVEVCSLGYSFIAATRGCACPPSLHLGA